MDTVLAAMVSSGGHPCRANSKLTRKISTMLGSIGIGLRMVAAVVSGGAMPRLGCWLQGGIQGRLDDIYVEWSVSEKKLAVSYTRCVTRAYSSCTRLSGEAG